MQEFDASRITLTPVDLPRPVDAKKVAFVLDNVFTPKECEDWISLTERTGYEMALVSTNMGDVLDRSYRHSMRCMIDDQEMADVVFNRIKDFLPQSFGNWKLKRLNERLRFLRYENGDFFAPHQDGCFVTSDRTQRSYVTIQLYLSEGAEGGETTFLFNPSKRTEKDVAVIPKVGRVLVFRHDIWHEGSLVTGGRKYTVRTDVMYERTAE